MSPQIAWKFPKNAWKGASNNESNCLKLPKIPWEGSISLHKKGWAFATPKILGIAHHDHEEYWDDWLCHRGLRVQPKNGQRSAQFLSTLTLQPLFSLDYHSNFLDFTSPFFRELISAIISPPITPNNNYNFWGVNKRNSQENSHHPVLSLLGKLHNLLHQNILGELTGIINSPRLHQKILGESIV